MNYRTASPFFLATLVAFNTLAEDSEQAHTLTITGSPIQQSIEGPTEQLAEYDNQIIIDAGDLLTRIAGISAIRNGGHGLDPVLRGQSQTRINLLQQGAFLHGAGPNRMDSPGSYTEAFGWDEVQIIKGVETLTLGSGGPAGSINFKRLRPEIDDNGVSGKMMAAYGSDSFKVGADLTAGNNNGYFRLISQLIDHDSYKDGDDQPTRTAFNTMTNTLVTGYTPNEDSELRLSLMANRGSDALFAGSMMDGPTTDMDAAQLLYTNGDPDGKSHSEYQLYWNRAHHMMDNYSLREQTAAMRMLTDSHSESTGAKWLHHWQTEQMTWQASLDWQNVERHAERYMGMMGTPDILQSQIWPDNQLQTIGAAIEGEYTINSANRIKSGIRFDRVNASANDLKDIQLNNLYTSYYAATPDSSVENNFSAFGRYYRQQASDLYWIGLSSTTRTADATERYIGANNNMPMMRWIGNPDLAPERHNQFEVGAKWHFKAGWHELNLYFDEVDDFILRDRARGQAGILAMDMATIYRNVDARLQGFEWTINHQLNAQWSVNGNLAYVKGENLETDVPLYQIPPIEGLVQLARQHDALAYWIDLRFALEQNRVDDNMMTGSALDASQSDAWQAIDFKIRYQLTENWQVAGGINNLFDETYAYHVSRANLDPFNPQAIRVNEPGRNLWVSVLVHL